MDRVSDASAFHKNALGAVERFRVTPKWGILECGDLNVRLRMITPFTIQVDEEKLSDLRQRLQNTRWPYQVPGSEWRSGTDVEYLKELVQYWLDGFNWREQEASLNRLPSSPPMSKAPRFISCTNAVTQVRFR